MSNRVGVDEAGRGPLAGPLVAVAVLGESHKLNYCQDSKLLTARRRQQLLARIKQDAAQIGIGWADAKYIDEFGISRALDMAARQAFSQISYHKEVIIIDGKVNFLRAVTTRVKTMIKADRLVREVSAASIVAKCFRDNYMVALADVDKLWSFDEHKGYGTAKHLKLLASHSPSRWHRKSFKPTQVSQGKNAELAAARYLKKQGYKIVAQNWKTPVCEIDIVARHKKKIYFFEVKYRASLEQGGGFDYIHGQKLKDMQFAAKIYCLDTNYLGNYELGAIEVTGANFERFSVISELAI